MDDENVPSTTTQDNIPITLTKQLKDPDYVFGRPTKYNKVIANQVLTLLANGTPLAKCADAVGLHRSQLYDWIDLYPDFNDKYRIARERFAHSLVGEALEIIDNKKGDLYDDGKRLAVNTAAPQRDHRRIEYRRWLAGCYNPLYRDDAPVTNINVGVAIDRPSTETREQWLERRQKELAAIGKNK